jgi:hypothetical protein
MSPSSQREQIMNARHRHSQFRLTVLAMIAVACVAMMFSASESMAGGPHSGTYAIGDGDKSVILRIENSTFPTPPAGSETSPRRE